MDSLNNGATTISSIKEYKEKYALNLAGISELKAIVDENRINCDWWLIANITSYK